MGNIDSRARNQNGYLYVKTDKPYYYPGNTVLGKMYIRIEHPLHVKKLVIKIKGVGKSGFLRHETVNE